MPKIPSNIEPGEHKYRNKIRPLNATPIFKGGDEVAELKAEVVGRRSFKPIMNIRPLISEHLDHPMMYRLKEGTFIAQYPGDNYVFAIVDEEGFEPVKKIRLSDIMWHTLIFMRVEPSDQIYPTVRQMKLRVNRVQELEAGSPFIEAKIRRINQTPKFDQYEAKLIPGLIIKLYNPSRQGEPYNEDGVMADWLVTWNGSLEYR